MKKNVVIIGLGLIGGSLAKAFQKYSECSVSGMDRDPAVLEAALKSGAIDGVAGERSCGRRTSSTSACIRRRTSTLSRRTAAKSRPTVS